MDTKRGFNISGLQKFIFQLPGLSEILLIGFYEPEKFTEFIDRCQKTYRISIKYLKEPQPLGKTDDCVTSSYVQKVIW